MSGETYQVDDKPITVVGVLYYCVDIVRFGYIERAWGVSVRKIGQVYSAEIGHTKSEHLVEEEVSTSGEANDDDSVEKGDDGEDEHNVEPKPKDDEHLFIENIERQHAQMVVPGRKEKRWWLRMWPRSRRGRQLTFALHQRDQTS